MTKLLPSSIPTNEDDLLQRIADLQKRMHVRLKFDMDGELISVETTFADIVENLADRPKNELPHTSCAPERT